MKSYFKTISLSVWQCFLILFNYNETPMKWKASEHLYKNIKSTVDKVFNTLDASMHHLSAIQLTVAAILKN